MKHFKTFLVIIFVWIPILLPSCRPETDDSYPEIDIYVYNFSQIFESFWHGMNRNYLYWDSEPVSSLWLPVFVDLPSGLRSNINNDPMAFWDIMYDHYKPKFDALGEIPLANLPSSPAAQTAYDLFAEMTSGLCDGNFKIVMEDGRIIWPANNRREAGYNAEPFPWASGVFFYSDLTDINADLSVDYTDQSAYFRTYNFVDNVIKNYFAPLYDYEVIKDISAGDSTFDDTNFRFVRGTIPHTNGGKILYLSSNYCLLFPLYNDIEDAYERFLDDLDDSDVKGIIMDLRGNVGGSLYDIGFFWGRIVDASLTYSETRAKSGEGRLEYGPWIPNRILPAPEGEKTLASSDAKIVFLVDGGTASTAELMTMAAKAYENAVIVGTSTFGAANSSASEGNNTAYNGGAFRVDHFIEYAGGAEVQNRDVIDKKIYEGAGIEPDIEVEMTEADWLNFYGQTGTARDKQLERAIKEIDPSRNF